MEVEGSSSALEFEQRAVGTSSWRGAVSWRAGSQSGSAMWTCAEQGESDLAGAARATLPARRRRSDGGRPLDAGTSEHRDRARCVHEPMDALCRTAFGVVTVRRMRLMTPSSSCRPRRASGRSGPRSGSSDASVSSCRPSGYRRHSATRWQGRSHSHTAAARAGSCGGPGDRVGRRQDGNVHPAAALSLHAARPFAENSSEGPGSEVPLITRGCGSLHELIESAAMSQGGWLR